MPKTRCLKNQQHSVKLVKWLGPRRKGDDIDDPYVDYAAAMQHLFEKVSLKLIDHYLGDIIKQTGKLCFAGGGALNVKLNQKIIALDYVKELFAQPAGSVMQALLWCCIICSLANWH